MNKMVKGSLAGVAGVTLLLGSFGTYALWSDAEDIDASEVSSGVLDIKPGDTIWADASTGRTNDAWDSKTDLMVPGDEVTRTQTFTITGTGKNLTGTVKVDEGTLGDVANKLNFGEYLMHTLVVTSDNAQVTRTGDTNGFAFKAPFGEADLTAVVTYTLAEGTPAQAAQDATAELTASTITIEQNDRS